MCGMEDGERRLEPSRLRIGPWSRGLCVPSEYGAKLPRRGYRRQSERRLLHIGRRGRISNVGQQSVPVALENGARTVATFQVADVSRPLMSVGRVCEMGNRVLFGAGGGYILNVSTGEATPFYKRDGVYVFTMWIPPLQEAIDAGFARPA